MFYILSDIQNNKVIRSRNSEVKLKAVKKTVTNDVKPTKKITKRTPLLARFSSVIHVKAHLLRDNYANFYSKYHDHANTDYFYKLLVAKYKKHLEALNIDSPQQYKKPFTDDGFEFKNQCTKYFKDELACMPEDLHGKDVIIELTISLYDFVSKDTQKRIVGMSIKGLSIYLMKNQE